MSERGWTQRAATAQCRATQPRTTDLLRGRISRFSLNTLVTSSRPSGYASECTWTQPTLLRSQQRRVREATGNRGKVPCPKELADCRALANLTLPTAGALQVCQAGAPARGVKTEPFCRYTLALIGVTTLRPQAIDSAQTGDGKLRAANTQQ
jgi:hypothetical protein